MRSAANIVFYAAEGSKKFAGAYKNGLIRQVGYAPGQRVEIVHRQYLPHFKPQSFVFTNDIHGTLWSHFEPGQGEFTLDMKLYDVSQNAQEAAALAELGTFSPAESGCPLLEDMRLSVPMTMMAGEVRSALSNGAPLEVAMDGYTLRVTQAEMSEAGARFALERIYESRDAALADPPDGETFWTYELLSADGAKWVATSFGNLPEAPVELEDGQWAWQYSTRVYYMFCQPETVVLRARRFTGNGYDESANEDVLLTFA